LIEGGEAILETKLGEGKGYLMGENGVRFEGVFYGTEGERAGVSRRNKGERELSKKNAPVALRIYAETPGVTKKRDALREEVEGCGCPHL